MAGEAAIVNLLGKDGGDPVYYTVDHDAAIEKGTLLKMDGARKVSAANVYGQPFAGVAAAEKVAADGETKLAVYTRGIFNMTVSGSLVKAGGLVVCSGSNTVVRLSSATGAQTALDVIASGAVVGRALEDSTGRTQFRVLIG